MKSIFAASAAAAVFLAGCETAPPPGVERGPHGTIAYDVLVEASPPSARIEANGEYVGTTPVHLKIFGDKDGTFHDFGSYYYIIRALPVATNQYPQIRVFGTGRNFSHEDYIPKQIYFDMNQPPPPPPTYPYPGYGPPVYYGPPDPYYYYGPPFYYGPSFRFYFGGHRHW
ncbi:MAG TPA: hypothetical protein VNZ64_05615 [Candidatus Acidoferrum sp.]|jgi:hypothetical protein|nr:hypothetical protein [Candidatus Acidoferrum sp.]